MTDTTSAIILGGSIIAAAFVHGTLQVKAAEVHRYEYSGSTSIYLDRKTGALYKCENRKPGCFEVRTPK